MDVALSPLGQQQAQALGRWFARQPHDERPHKAPSSAIRKGFVRRGSVAGSPTPWR
jgi:broad specificity phosphatase PhoE